jgi:hypothetical protein
VTSEPRMVAYGGKGRSHWGQAPCGSCGAWLKTMPDRHDQPGDSSAWMHYFVCVACGHEYRQVSATPPEQWTVDPDATIHPPGSVPQQPVRDPDRWVNAPLAEAEKSLVRDSYALIDSLSGQTTIHQVARIWAIRRALGDQDLSALIIAAAEYVNLLDYEAIHGMEHDTYGGTEGDTTAIRADLQQIPQALALHAESDYPWRPAGRGR